MYIMLELPKIKTVLLFKNSQDFNQTTHGRPQEPIVFIKFIISVYVLTVLVLWNMFSNGHVKVTSCLFMQYDPSPNPKNSVYLVWKVGKVLMHSSKCQFFHISKWQLMIEIQEDLIRKYFICYIVFQFFLNNSKVKLVVAVSSFFYSLSSTKPLLASVVGKRVMDRLMGSGR